MSKRGNRREHERRLVQSGPKSYPQRVGFSDMSGDNATLSAQPPKGGTGFITKLVKGQTVVVGAIDIASPTPAPSVALPMSGGVGKHVYVNAGGGDVMTAAERIAGVKAGHSFQARASDMLDRAGIGDRAAQRWCSDVLGGFTLPSMPDATPADGDAVPTPSATRAGDGGKLKQAKSTGAGSASAPLSQLIQDPSAFNEALGMPAAIEAAQGVLAAAQEAAEKAPPGEKRKAKERVKAAQESLDAVQDRSDEILHRLATALVGARRAADVDVEIRPHPTTGEPTVYVVTRPATARVQRTSTEWRQTLVIQRAVAKLLGLAGMVSTTRRDTHVARQAGHTVHVSRGISLVEASTQVRVEKLSRGSVTVFVSGRGQGVYTRREIEAAMERQ